MAVGSGSTDDSASSRARIRSCRFRSRASRRASSRSRFEATANSHDRSLVIVSCLSARTNVSCAISSAASRSPSRRVRKRTSGA
jgi:hypothetical protein